MKNTITTNKGIKSFLNNTNDYPDLIKGLKDEELKIKLSTQEIEDQGIRHNVFTADDKTKITVINLGHCLKARAEEYKSEVKTILNPERLIVIYNDGTQQTMCDDLPKIDSSG